MKEKLFEAGNLRFTVEHRTFGEDGGPALRVLGDVSGRVVQLLRFDCFEKEPHYHIAPSGRDEVHPIDRGKYRDPVTWTVRQVCDSLPDLVRRAGYPEIAAGIDRVAVWQVMLLVEEEMRRKPS